MLTSFRCSLYDSVRSATDHDYVCAGYWPGIPDQQSHYYCRNVLRFWYHLKHKTPGTSEGQFLKILEEISFEAERVFD